MVLPGQGCIKAAALVVDPTEELIAAPFWDPHYP